MSRAYYCVYHLGLERAKSNDFRFVQGGVHAQLWRVFSESPDPECKRLGTIAGRLRERRERADYETQFLRIDEEIPIVLADARDFVNRLAKLPSRLPNPASIRR
jgi:uncharacterized protein (UPF0332 family)